MPSLSAQLANANVAKRERAFVIALEPDVADLGAAELRPRLEFGRRHLRLPVGAPQLVLHHFEAVEPVLDVWSLGDDARAVPLADRLQVTFGRGVETVGRGGAGQTRLVVGRFVVVEELVLRPRRI